MPDGAWIHYGLTSSDVVDTALCWAMRDGLDVILEATDDAARDARRPRPPTPPHRDDRAHARHPCRADDVRRQGGALGAAAGPRPVTTAGGARDHRRLQALGRRRHVRQHRPGRRGLRRRAARAPSGAGDTSHRSGPPRRVPVGAGGGRQHVRIGGGRAAPLATHRGRRGPGRLRTGAEGLVGDAAQAQPDLGRDDQRLGPGGARQSAGWSAGCRACGTSGTSPIRRSNASCCRTRHCSCTTS